MDFRGPDPADFANVRALNDVFLQRLRDGARGSQLRQSLPPPVPALLEGLTTRQLGRLSDTPFLLLSLRERDEPCWQALTSDEPNLDLLDSDRDDELVTAAASFLWHLARRNPYATRLVSGASLAWCDRLVDCTLMDLMLRARRHPNLLRVRFAGNLEFWCKLLGPGLSSDATLRRAAHLTCLQVVLTDVRDATYQPLKTAACRNPAPAFGMTGFLRRE